MDRPGGLTRTKPPLTAKRYSRLACYSADRYFAAKTKKRQNWWYAMNRKLVGMVEAIAKDPNCNQDTTFAFLFQDYQGA